MRNVASTSQMSNSVTRDLIDQRSMIRSTASSIHELSTRGGLAQPLVTGGAGLVVASLSSIRRILSVIQRAPVSVAKVNHIRSHDVQSEKEGTSASVLCADDMGRAARTWHHGRCSTATDGVQPCRNIFVLTRADPSPLSNKIAQSLP